MTHVIFVRHAQPDFLHSEDRTRPLTSEGLQDTALVLETLRNENIDCFYSSPYRRAMDTIRSTADHFGMPIFTDERFRERQSGKAGNSGKDLFRMRWADKTWHEEGGESISMVQRRNVEALRELLENRSGQTIVIGTHGTALSAIMNYYRPEFGVEDFLRIIDWMPYLVELDFEGQELKAIRELAYREKEYRK